MKTSFIGFIFSFIIIFASVFYTTDDLFLYYNFLGILIVFGGTLTAGVTTFGIGEIYRAIFIFFKFISKEKFTNEGVVENLVGISVKINSNPSVLSEISKDKSNHPFINDGLQLIENQFGQEKIIEIMSTMTIQKAKQMQREVNLVKTLSKYPTSFGMMGTVIGLIAVLQQMGSVQGISNIGPNMAVALITTLYGLFLTYYFLQPIADALTNMNNKDIEMRKIIIRGITLIQENEDPVFVREILLSYLKIEHKNKLSTALKEKQNDFYKKAG